MRLPTFFEKMPFSKTENIFRLSLLYNQGKEVELKPSAGNDDDVEIVQDMMRREPFETFFEYLDESDLSEIESEFNEGFEIYVKSNFEIQTGSIKKIRRSYLEHYLLCVQERPEIFQKYCFELLKSLTYNSDSIIEEFRSKYHRLLGHLL